jgi:hypothetical protein
MTTNELRAEFEVMMRERGFGAFLPSTYEWMWRAYSAAAEPREKRIAELETALRFYADKDHFTICDDMAWDTVSGEPSNFWCDEAGTATVEDGWVARAALTGTPPPPLATPQSSSGTGADPSQAK